ncbi:tetratricopeptide repeat protein [bacterium]|nr:tetratricopeptide repeat protein [bacterium]MBP9809927.1 tetratricopeptide repeat protein [bacterium]
MTVKFLVAISLLIALDTGLPSLAAINWQSSYGLGQTALSEQNLPQAEDYFRRALAQVEKQQHNADDLAKCLTRLADTLALSNKTTEAQATYQRLLSVLESKYGKNSAKIAPALIALGSVQESEGDHTAAMPYYQRAFELNEKNYGPYSPEIVSSLHRLARSTYKAGFKEPAAKHYKRAMSILLNQPGLEASNQLPSLIGDYKDLIKGDEQSSQDLLKEFKKDIALPPEATSRTPQSSQQSAFQEQSTSKLSSDHSFQTEEESKILLRGLNQNYSEQALNPAYKTMNEAIFDQNHFGKGEDFYQRKIAADIASLGANHPSNANDLSGLALFYISQKRYSEADALLTKALGIYKAAYGSNNILTIRTMATLASTKMHLGQNQQAEELYKSALALSQTTLGPNNIETARILNDLAFLYYSQDKLKDAKTFYQWALASTEGAVGKSDPLLAACLKDYAQVLHSLGSESESIAAADKAKLILTK